MSHLAPHRLADLAAGAITGRAAARALRHVDGCATCRRAFARIKSGRASFPDLAALPAPELPWDRIRAQTYWTVGPSASSSVALPVAAPAPRSRWRFAVPALGLAAAAAIAFWQLAPERGAIDTPVAGLAPGSATPAPAAPAPRAGVVTLVEAGGTIATADGRTIVGGNAIGAYPLGPGDRITTDSGRLAVQFEAGSTFTVGPHSTLALARFDRGTIELALGDAGRVDVEVGKRAPDERFLVRAGDRLVEVRGTAFRVERTGAKVAVACEHGRVAVSSDGAAVELGARQAIEIADREPLLGRAARPLAEAELGALLAARPPALAQWTDPETVYRTTAGLSLVAAPGHTVAVDGVPIGSGAVWRRVAPGRHLVESTDGAGRTPPGQWIEVDASSGEKPIVLAAAPAPHAPAADPRAARRARLGELKAAIDETQLRGCVRSLAKQGLAEGTHVELDVGVNAAGAFRYVNIVESDLPDSVTACVRDVVGAARLGPGAQVSWRHRVAF